MSGQKFFRAPFAVTGDKTAIPDTAQVDGSISWPEGFGFDYQRDPETDPDAKRMPRNQTNQYLFDITSNLLEYQLAGFPEWVTAAQNGGVDVSYPINAYVRHNGGSGTDWAVYASLIDGATKEPGVDVDWQDEWVLFNPSSLADLKATQAQVNEGTGTKLAGALELVKAAREGRWYYGGAAVYGTPADLTLAMPGSAAFTLVAGATVSFSVPTTNVGGDMTLKVDAQAATALRLSDGSQLAPGDLSAAGGVYTVVFTGTQWRLVQPTLSQLARYASAGDGAIFGYIATNTPGALTTQVTMGFGNCRDSTNQRSIPRTSPMAKSLTAQWVAGNGNGGRDQVTGPAANETWHVHAILNDTTAATDILLSKSPTAPNLPGGYTYFRRVFSILLDASAQIRQFLHLPDDYVALKTRGVEWAVTANGVAAGTLRDIGVPKGLKLKVRFYHQSQGVGGSNPNPALSGVYDPDIGVPVFGTPTQWAQHRIQWSDANTRYGTLVFEEWCNTNAQVYTASNDTGDTIAGGVLGWYDQRGRFV